MRGDDINVRYRSVRYTGYRMFTWWVQNRFGISMRKVIPLRATWVIHDAYMEADSTEYALFQEARNEMNAQVFSLIFSI